MPNHLKKSAIIAFVVLFISGILATIVEYKFIEVTTEIKKNIIRFHVSWTVLTAIVFGMILEGHARKFWRQTVWPRPFLVHQICPSEHARGGDIPLLPLRAQGKVVG